MVKYYSLGKLIIVVLFISFDCYGLLLLHLTEVWILQGKYQLKDEWVFGCSLETRLADQTKTQQLKW